MLTICLSQLSAGDEKKTDVFKESFIEAFDKNGDGLIDKDETPNRDQLKNFLINSKHKSVVPENIRWASLGVSELKDFAEEGSRDAQFYLGRKFHWGRGVSENKKEAYKWFLKAANQGHPEAQYQVGVFNKVGWGVLEDDLEAQKWYRKAAEQGHPGGQYEVGKNAKGIEESLKWWHKAAEQGHGDSQATIGFYHYTTFSKNRNWVLSYAWYSIAAQNGNSDGKKYKEFLRNRKLDDADVQAGQSLVKEMVKKNPKLLND